MQEKHKTRSDRTKTADRPHRRQAFKTLGGLLLAGGGVFTIVNYIATREGTIDEWAIGGAIADLPIGEPQRKVLRVTEHGVWFSRPVDKVIWVRRNPDETVTVFTGACPHMACTTNWRPDLGIFDCACHKSAFNPSGDVIEGPSLRPMDTLEHRVENGVLSVRYQKFRQEIATREVLT